MGKLRQILPDGMRQPNGRKIRKDAVLAVEYLFTTSPEWAENASEAAQDEFFSNSLTWLQNKYGAQNVFTATIQRDETTPHMSAFVVPITPDGRLCAQDYIGSLARLLDRDLMTCFPIADNSFLINRREAPKTRKASHKKSLDLSRHCCHQEETSTLARLRSRRESSSLSFRCSTEEVGVEPTKHFWRRGRDSNPQF